MTELRETTHKMRKMKIVLFSMCSKLENIHQYFQHTQKYALGTMTAKWKYFIIVLLCLQAEEERDEKEQIKKIQYMKQIQHQMTENENKQILELKCKEEESRLISEIQMQIKLDEQEAYKRKLAEQKQTRDNLNDINSQIEHFHKMQLEEDRINDMKVR